MTTRTDYESGPFGNRQAVNPLRRKIRETMRLLGVSSGRQKVRLRKAIRWNIRREAADANA